MTKTPTDEILRNMRAVEAEWTRASRSLAAAMPKEMAGAFNLMAHPAAFASAGAIVGMGMASQAMGHWMGTWMGAAEIMQRAMSGTVTPDAQPAANEASNRARAAMDTLMADAQSLADEVVKPAGAPPPPAAKPVKKAEAPKAKPAARKAAKPAKEKAAKPAPGPAALKKEAAPAVAAKAEAPGSAMPAAMPKPAQPDDLKQISGVGPKLEQVLNGLGIWTYGQISALTPAEIDWIEDYLSFKGRIGRDDWLGQAAKLGKGGA